MEKTLRFEFNRVYSGGNKDLRGELYTLLDEHEAEGSTLAHGQALEEVTVDGVADMVNTEAMFY